MVATRKRAILSLAIHVGALAPLVWLIGDFLTDNLTVNPIQAATLRTGKYALTFLVLTLACTPVSTITGYRRALKLRRTFGLYTFLYASVHLTIFAWIDYGLDWSLLQEALLEKQYALAGLGTYLLLLPLAITSFGRWKRQLGQTWRPLHRLVYVAALLAVLHYAWGAKGDVLRLQGDIAQPVAFGLVIALLLILRIPMLRRGIVQARAALRSPSRPST